MDTIIQLFNSLLPDSKGKSGPPVSGTDTGTNRQRAEFQRLFKKRAENPNTPTEELGNLTRPAFQLLDTGRVEIGAKPQDNVYGEVPLPVNSGPADLLDVSNPTRGGATPLENAFASVGGPEYGNSSGGLPFPTYYSPGSFINGGEEIDADNIVLSLLGRNATDPAKGAADAVTRASLGGLKHGGDTAQSQKQEGLINEASDMISGLLGNVDFKGLFRVLARPEFVAPMGPGQTPLTNFVNAAAADRTAQAATRAAQQEAGLEGFKAETDRLKAQMPDPSKMPKLTGEVSKLYDQLASSSRIGEIGTKIKAMVNDSAFATGGGGAAAQGVRGVASVFGVDLGSFTADQVESKIAVLKSEILKSKVFGREANKQELTMILNKMLANPSLLTSKSQILDTVDDMMRRAEQTGYNAAGKLKYFGYRTEGFDKPAAPAFTRNN